MAYFMRQHRNVVRYGSNLAEGIVCKELKWNVNGVYDIQTLADSDAAEKQHGVFAQLLKVEHSKKTLPGYYRICLHDTEILTFLQENPSVDLLSLITFIMTHELLHIHRFSTGMADFFGDTVHEEMVVDTLTRLFLAKNPVIGLRKALYILDKVEAAPLYNEKILKDQGRIFRAYL